MSEKPKGGQSANKDIVINKGGRITPLSAGIPLPNSRGPLPPSGAARPVHDTLPPPPRKPK